jgi:16S rRNA (guanine966-N2)-methyltransferase
MSRVIAGSAGGRRLAVPGGRGTRPTSDRTREGLFSTLQSLIGDLTGVSFLDLYAGSGAVGLEAASRGARPVGLVEREARAARAIRANIAALGSSDVTLVESTVKKFLERAPVAYDVVFIDPPYADPVTETLAALINGWLAVDAVVCVERATRDVGPPWPEGIEAVRSRRYGDSTLWYGRAS